MRPPSKLISTKLRDDASGKNKSLGLADGAFSFAKHMAFVEKSSSEIVALEINHAQLAPNVLTAISENIKLSSLDSLRSVALSGVHKVFVLDHGGQNTTDSELNRDSKIRHLHITAVSKASSEGK